MLSDHPVGTLQAGGSESDPADVPWERACREVALLGAIDSDYLPKIGPITLNCEDIDGERLIYFSEEFIEGLSLRVGFESHAARANLRTRSMTEAA